MGRDYDVINFISKDIKTHHADIKIAIMLIKTTLKMQWKSQEFLENFIKKQFLHVFRDITKIINFYWKTADVTRT